MHGFQGHRTRTAPLLGLFLLGACAAAVPSRTRPAPDHGTPTAEESEDAIVIKGTRRPGEPSPAPIESRTAKIEALERRAHDSQGQDNGRPISPSASISGFEPGPSSAPEAAAPAATGPPPASPGDDPLRGAGTLWNGGQTRPTGRGGR